MMRYLVRPGNAGVCHYWDGHDTFCKLSHNRVDFAQYLVKDATHLHVCRMCSNVRRRMARLVIAQNDTKLLKRLVEEATTPKWDRDDSVVSAERLQRARDGLNAVMCRYAAPELADAFSKVPETSRASPSWRRSEMRDLWTDEASMIPIAAPEIHIMN